MARSDVSPENGLFSEGVIPEPGAVQPGEESRAESSNNTLSAARDPFGFSQGRLFAPPEKGCGQDAPPDGDSNGLEMEVGRAEYKQIAGSRGVRVPLAVLIL